MRGRLEATNTFTPNSPHTIFSDYAPPSPGDDLGHSPSPTSQPTLIRSRVDDVFPDQCLPLLMNGKLACCDAETLHAHTVRYYSTVGQNSCSDDRRVVRSTEFGDSDIETATAMHTLSSTIPSGTSLQTIARSTFVSTAVEREEDEHAAKDGCLETIGGWCFPPLLPFPRYIVTGCHPSKLSASLGALRKEMARTRSLRSFQDQS